MHSAGLRSSLQVAGLVVGIVFGSSASAQEPELLITGGNDRLQANIRAHVTLPDLDCDASAVRLGRFLPGIRQSIVRAARALGYYHLEQQSRFEAAESCWRLHVEVEPGAPVLVGEVNVAVASDAELFTSQLQQLPLQTGQQLDQGAYERIKTNLSARAIEQGFFDARFSRSELQLDLVNNTATVDMLFNPGERYRIGAVNIQELPALSEEFINRFLEFAPGDYYSSESLLAMRNSLNSSHYFSSVSVSPLINQASNNEVPVNISLSMRPQRVYATGLGMTTDIGPRVRFDYENRYRNRNGHNIIGNMGLSPVQQNLDLGYGIPLADPATESLKLSVGFLAEDTDTFRNESTRVGATYSFINSWNWRQHYFLNLQHDESDISGETLTADFVIPGVSMDRTSANDVLYPTRGWRLFGELKGASDTLLSSESFLQLNFSGKLIQSVGSGRVLLRFDAGTTLANDLDRLPTSIRYFSGGDQTVRGYKYESLGPVNDAGEVVGGKHKLAMSVEYDFPISESWKLAVFADAGNAFNAFDDYELKTGAGLGVRWLSPIGPIRVDLASALDNDNKVRLHITMGPDL